MNLLDDLDKELNNYIMRCREWYVGWVGFRVGFEGRFLLGTDGTLLGWERQLGFCEDH